MIITFNFFIVSPLGSVEIRPPVANVSFGSNTTFICSSQGGPNNQYLWTHSKSGEVIHNGPELTITYITFTDGGTYECNVTNEAGYDVGVSMLYSGF